MSLFDDLRSLINAPDHQNGLVVSVHGDTVMVATANGIVEASRNGTLTAGDTVIVKNYQATRLQKGVGKLFQV